MSSAAQAWPFFKPFAKVLGVDTDKIDHILSQVPGLKQQIYDMSDHFCLLYTSDAADERSSVDLGGRRIIKKKNKKIHTKKQSITTQSIHTPTQSRSTMHYKIQSTNTSRHYSLHLSTLTHTHTKS